MTPAEIDSQFDMLKWETSGFFWRAAKELGIEAQFNKATVPAGCRRCIIHAAETPSLPQRTFSVMVDVKTRRPAQ